MEQLSSLSFFLYFQAVKNVEMKTDGWLQANLHENFSNLLQFSMAKLNRIS